MMIKRILIICLIFLAAVANPITMGTVNADGGPPRPCNGC